MHVGQLPYGFKVISWNLRFTDNFPDLRLESALEHLQKVLSTAAKGGKGDEEDEDEVDDDDDRYGPEGTTNMMKKTANTENELSEDVVDMAKKLDWAKDRTWGKAGRAPPPCVILLQEVHARAIKSLLGFRWVRKYFYVTPKDQEKFAHGTCFASVNLVSKQLRTGVSRVLEFNRASCQERSALMTEVLVGIRGPPGIATLRIVNVHLESNDDGLGMRRDQVGLVRKMVTDCRKGEVAPYGVIVAGAFNAGAAGDKPMILEHGLQDAWIGDDDDPKAHTWGYQGGPKVSEKPGRIDRITFVPSRGVAVLPPERIGVGLRRDWDIEKWVSDHYGIMSEVRMI